MEFLVKKAIVLLQSKYIMERWNYKFMFKHILDKKTRD